MRNNQSLINNYLYDNYDQNYKSYNSRHQLLCLIQEKLEIFKKYLGKFIKKKLDSKIINDKDKKEKFSNFKKDDFCDFYFLIEKTIETSIKNNFQMINKTIEQISVLRTKLTSYFEVYDNFCGYQKTFLNKLKEIEDCKNKFFESTKKAEDFTYDFYTKKVYNKPVAYGDFDQKEALKNTVKEDYVKYNNKINEGNEELKQFNKIQNKLFITERELERQFDGIYSECIYSFYEHQEVISQKAKNINNKLVNEKKTQKVLHDSLKIYEEKKQIDFVQYQSQIEYNDYNDNLKSSARMVAYEEISRIIGKYKEIEYSQENNKIKMNADIEKIVYSNEISEEDFKKLLEYLKIDLGQNLFITFLSLLRTKGKYQKSKRYIEIMGKLLNTILDYNEEKKNYDKAKNCIILSQTFYYCEDLSNEKIYIYEYLKDNKWIKKSDFWRNFIDIMIQDQLAKVKITKIQELGEILLSQLVPMINNMISFEIDNRIIVKIIDEVLGNYDYKLNDVPNALFSFINKDKKEIEKLRKEYIDDPDLEKKLYNNEKSNEIINEIKNEKNNEINNEKNNEINNEKYNIINNENNNKINNEKNNEKNKENDIFNLLNFNEDYNGGKVFTNDNKGETPRY